MKSLFTVHAGEVLVGSQIEQRFKSAELWLPAKDTGVDLLVTNGKRGLAVSLQVKFSQDFLVAHLGSRSIKRDCSLAAGGSTAGRRFSPAKLICGSSLFRHLILRRRSTC